MRFSITTLLTAIIIITNYTVYSQVSKLKKKVVIQTKKVIHEQTVECQKLIEGINRQEKKLKEKIESGNSYYSKQYLKNYVKKVEDFKTKKCLNFKDFEKKIEEYEVKIAELEKVEVCDKYVENTMNYVDKITRQLNGETYYTRNSVEDDIQSYESEVYYAKEDGCVNEVFEHDLAKWRQESRVVYIKSTLSDYFYNAIKEGNKAKMDTALSYGTDVNGGTVNGYSFSSTNTAVLNNDLETLKYLINKGAKYTDEVYENIYLNKNTDASMATLRYVLKHSNKKTDKRDFTTYVCQAIDVKRIDFIKELDNNKDLVREDANYRSCYWESHKISDNEIRTFFAKKVLAIDWETNFSDFKVGMNSPSVTSQMKSAIALRTGKRQYTHVKISSSDYTIVRNELTGIITHRIIYAICFLKQPDGVCIVDKLKFYQDYDGSSYTKMYVATTVGGTDLVNGL